MDKAKYKPYMNLLIERLINEGVIPDYLDGDNDAELVTLGHRFIDEDKHLALGLIAVALGHLYSLQEHIKEEDATKEEMHQVLDDRNIYMFCCQVLKLHSTDCKCIGKVAQKIYNEIKYKNISKLLT